MPEHRCRGAHGNHFAIDLHHHAEGAQVQVFGVTRPTTADEERRGGVVSHHAFQIELEAGETRVDNLHRRQHVVGGGQYLFSSAIGSTQFVFHDKGHLTLHARMNQPGYRDSGVFRACHTVSEKADRGHINTHLYHLGLRGQAGLPADQLMALFDKAPTQLILHRVAIGNGHFRIFVGQLGNGVGASLRTFYALTQTYHILTGQR